MGKERVLPAVDQFPTFADTLSWLTKEACRCIWYLPRERRYCSLGITREFNQSALEMARSISKADPLTEMAHKVLADIAERSCCGKWHRNYIWALDLKEKLATQWQIEIRATLHVTDCKIAQTVKLEGVSPSTSTVLNCSSKLSHPSVDPISDAQIRTAGHSDSKALPTCQAALTIYSFPSSKPVAFAKYEVLRGETLLSKLLSPIDPLAGKIGSLYIYTHTKDAFCGTIKIGFTCRTIESRLSDWNKCGHGYPVLLGSYDHVRHPARVELLTHFELLEYWHTLRWCGFHRKAHIEWFKTDIGIANPIVRLWSLWMERANPYDRRGYLKAFWKETIDFLTIHDIIIGAEVMMQVQEIEEGSSELREFIDDDALRKRRDPVAKHEQLDTSRIVVCLPQRTKASSYYPNEGNHLAS